MSTLAERIASLRQMDAKTLLIRVIRDDPDIDTLVTYGTFVIGNDGVAEPTVDWVFTRTPDIYPSDHESFPRCDRIQFSNISACASLRLFDAKTDLVKALFRMVAEVYRDADTMETPISSVELLATGVYEVCREVIIEQFEKKEGGLIQCR